MKRNILSLSVSFVVVLSTLLFTNVSAQTITSDDPRERMIILWNKALENIRTKHGLSQKEFNTFYSFDLNRIQLLRAQEESKAIKENFDPTLLIGTAKESEDDLEIMYEKFLSIKKEYPSSVAEYEHPRSLSTSNPCDSSGCTNIGFEQGTFNTWYGYYADDASTAATFNITGITGGALGAVTEACNDPTTMAYMNTNYHLGLTSDYQLSITSGGNDAIVPSIPRVSPFSVGGHSVMLGDSGFIGRGVAILSKTFLVNASTANLTYQYAVLLENPASHLGYEQPIFTVIALDENGDTIPTCGYYNVISGQNTSNFDSINSYDGNEAYDGTAKLFYRNWTIVNVPLKRYIGQCVTIEFQVTDCSLGGHFGYAYVDASCSPLVPLTSSPNFCGQDSISITAPTGATKYLWSDTMGIHAIRNGDSTTQTIWVDSAGTYQVIITPVTGASCNDTLKVTIGREPGPPPMPSFHTDTACAGQATRFFNTSNDTAKADSTTFYWDFYNIGVYNDTNVVNPTWVYASAGTYVVKLYALHKGCGAYFYDTIKVDSTVNGGFTKNNACVNTLINMTNVSTGGNKYIWNYGDPSSNPNDTCTICINGSHSYADTGHYTVTLIAKNGGPCPDTVRQIVIISAPPKPIISGDSNVCPGHSDTLTVTGGTTWLWSNSSSSTTQTVIVSPTSNKTFTVTACNNGCCHDTTFTVYVKAPAATITASADSVCSGDADTLKAGGGNTYTWSGGSHGTSLIVHPTTTTTYTLYALINPCNDSTTITIGIVKPNVDTVSLSADSICAGTPTTLSVTNLSGASPSYKWSNGATTTSITVSPDSTTTYYVLAKGKCNTDSVAQKVIVIPLPKPVITGRNLICNGAKDTLFVSGGTTYKWSNGTTKTSYITGFIKGDSTIYVTVNNGKCVAVDTFKIKEHLFPVVTTTKGIVCAGGCVQISASAPPSNGPYTYLWANGATTDTTTVCPSADSSFNVSVSNGCLTKAKATVNVYPISLYACCNTTLTEIPSAKGLTGDTAILTADSARSYKWTPSTSLNCDTCQTVIATPTVTTTYTVSGVDADGCSDIRVITVTVVIPCFELFVPNVFTPNGDGINDLFTVSINVGDNPNPTPQQLITPVVPETLDGYTITIYDRWGKQMFTSSNPAQPWDGNTEGGSKASDGVYYYIISATCQGQNYKKDGFVQLIR